MSISYAVFCLKKKTAHCGSDRRRLHPADPARRISRPLRQVDSRRSPAACSGRLVSFFSTAPATPAIYPLSLHDALPIYWGAVAKSDYSGLRSREPVYRTIRELVMSYFEHYFNPRSEEHTSELQSHVNLVCRLLLEKKNSPLR